MPNEDSEEPGMYVPECMCIKKEKKTFGILAVGQILLGQHSGMLDMVVNT